jgi:hypothetical protein
MSLLTRAISFGAQLFVLMFLCACDSGPAHQELAAAADDQVKQAAAAVEEYIARSKHWKKGTYEVKFQRKESTTLVFWVLNLEDRASNGSRTVKSVEVRVDPTSNRVIEELAFQ